MSKATDGFAEARVLGRGGQGVVYKGILPDGSTVAVKRSRGMEEKQVSEFAREMLILSQLEQRGEADHEGGCHQASDADKRSASLQRRQKCRND
jgi:serine/threonine protein kinase